MVIKVKRLDPNAQGLIAPMIGNAGYDICANGDVTLYSNRWTEVSTGIAVEIPKGYVGLVRGRSGLAFKHTIFSFDGTIDESYTGEWKLFVKLDPWKLFVKLDPAHSIQRVATYQIRKGDKVAQVVFVPYLFAPIEYTEELKETIRGENGFGSTGY